MWKAVSVILFTVVAIPVLGAAIALVTGLFCALLEFVKKIFSP